LKELGILEERILESSSRHDGDAGVYVDCFWAFIRASLRYLDTL
jgi:hypothetical protein